MVKRNPWEVEDRAGLMSIGSHKLHVLVAGPPRRHQGDVVVLLFSGGGMPVFGYTRLQRLLSRKHRILAHDRSGYGDSEPGKAPLTAERAATELQELLKRIAVPGPYILIGHSYGGIVAREFLHLTSSEDIAGMVLADTGAEMMYQAFPKIPAQALEVVADGVDFFELTNFRRESGLTDEEYEKLIKAIARTQPAALEEDSHESGIRLARLQQYRRHALDPKPLSVIRWNMVQDYSKLYQAGVAKGQGTPEQRAEARTFLERFGWFDDDLKTGQLRLSSCHRYVEHLDRGHDDALRRPETVAWEVDWVMEKHALVTH